MTSRRPSYVFSCRICSARCSRSRRTKSQRARCCCSSLGRVGIALITSAKEFVKTTRRRLGIDLGRANVTMPKIPLYLADRLLVGDELIARCMSKHVRMDRKRELAKNPRGDDDHMERPRC